MIASNDSEVPGRPAIILLINNPISLLLVFTCSISGLSLETDLSFREKTYLDGSFLKNFFFSGLGEFPADSFFLGLLSLLLFGLIVSRSGR